MADKLTVMDLLQDELIQPSLRYPSTEALATLAARLSGIDLSRELIYQINTVDPSALPFLMDQFDMLVCERWGSSPEDETRRNLILRSIEYHREKGTFSGIKKYVALAGGDVLWASTASDKFYAGEEITAEDRKLWKESFPEIRVYPFVQQSEEVACGVLGPAEDIPDSFLGSLDEPSFFCGEMDSHIRLGKKATLYRDGVALDLIWGLVQGDVEYEQLRIPGDGAGAYFADEVAFQDFLTDPESSERVFSYTLSPEDTYGGYQHNLLSPGMAPINVVPEEIFVGTTDLVGLYANDVWDLNWAVESTARYRVYGSLRLFDKERRANIPFSTAYLDHVRFPVDAYHAELRTSLPGVKNPLAFEFVDDFLIEDQTQPLYNSLEAIQESQSLRDRLYLNTKVHRPVRFGDRQKFGQFRFGDWKEI
jgi:hypothetical protein